MKKIDSISGNIVDVINSAIYPATLEISGCRISNIIRETRKFGRYILPGFIDSHIHIESSMLPPSEFARIASVHGTVAAVSDPHEIANVLGISGVKYMIDNGKKVPFKFCFGAPSCVPATEFETSGASIGLKEEEELLKLDDIKYLSEVMNYAAVINNEPAILRKIKLAKKYSKPIDGHAPSLNGSRLRKYVKAGIGTDHETSTIEEAEEKLALGMKIIIREGSAAKNFDALVPLLDKHYENCMFCSDDRHPDDLLKGHINDLAARAADYGIALFKILRAACVNPVLHYGLDAGLLRKGDFADFIVVDNLKEFGVLKTCINGQIVAEKGSPLIPSVPVEIINNFTAKKKNPHDFIVPYKRGKINVIEAIDGELTTNRLIEVPKVVNGYVTSDIARDILKIAEVNRYRDAKVSIDFAKNFGLKKGAIASSVAHDSHNIIAVGVTDTEICRAVNLIIENKGGICAVSGEMEIVLPLPVAGLMSNLGYKVVAEKYGEINNIAKAMGSKLNAPFMTLSFMALSVIPKIKLTDKGLFDGEHHKFINIFEEEE